MDQTPFERATQLCVTIRPNKIWISLISFARTGDGERPEEAALLSALSIRIGEAIIPVADQEMVVLDGCSEAAQDVLKALLARLDAALDDRISSS